MGIFSRFEDRMEDTVEGAASRMSKAPISPVQIAKRAERQMRRETMVGAGKEYAPTLYTVLVNPEDDARLFGYYPTLAGETETYLKAKAAEQGLAMDGDPLVRFIVDEGLKHGKFDIVAEVVAAPIIKQLRAEEMHHYGLAPEPAAAGAPAARRPHAPRTPSRGFASESYNDNYGEPYGDEYGNDVYDDYGYDQGYGDAYNDDYDQGYDDSYDEGANYGEPYDDYQEQQPMRPSPTVAYAGKAKRHDGTPDYRKVHARLVARSNHRPYDLAGSVVTMGRESANDISVKDVSASRYHAELKMTPQGTWVVTDLNSTNGTLVNGTKVASQPLYPGDVITIGKTDFEFTVAQ